MRAIDMFQVVRNNEADIFFSEVGNFDVSQINENGQNLLHEAVAYNNVLLGGKLIEMGVDVNGLDSKSQTPLHYAANYNAQALAEVILRHGGNLGIEDCYGNQALWTAVFNARGDYGLVLEFLRYGPDVNHRNKAGRSPLDFARQIGDQALIDILSNAQAPQASG